MNCSNAFYDNISNCNTAIRVNALLSPATPYTVIIKGKFGKEYSVDIVTNGDGFFDVAIADLPDGFFTPFSGAFSLEIMDGTSECRKLDFKMAKYYDSIVFDATAGPRQKDNLGCDFDCQGSGDGPQNSAVFPFTDIATLNIAWTTFLRGLYGGTPTVQVYLQTSPGEYALTTVSVTMVGGPYDLSEIDIDFGGTATGYVLIS